MSNDKLYAPDKGAVLEAANGRWKGIFDSLCPELSAAQAKPGRSFPCPVHGGKDGFRIFKKTAGSTSGGVCQTCGTNADGIALIRWVNRWTFPETLQQIGSLLGIQDPNGRTGIDAIKPRPIAKTQSDKKGPSDSWIIEWLRTTWKQTVPITDPAAEPARLYLRSRGIISWDRVGLEKSVRFHPALMFKHDDGKTDLLPAIVALIKGIDGKAITIHRIYLSPKGEKACGGESKKMFAIPSDRTLVGGCVETSPTGEDVDICEGLETAMAIETALGIPVWPTVNAYLLENFEPRLGTKRVFVWADKDTSLAGQQAAANLRQRLASRGIAVHIMLPRMDIPSGAKGVDWNDVLLWQGKHSFRRRLSALRVA